MIKIAVIGLGFVGLTTAVGFALKGFEVSGYDKDKAKQATLKAGQVPFHEPALAKHFDKGMIKLTDTLEAATGDADVVFLCVGTPQADDGSVDLSQITQALGEIKARPDTLVVVKSTVPPGTTATLKSAYPLANNPEFLREGFAFEDFMTPDRVVCGTSDETSKKILSELYAPFNAPVHFTSLSTAEFIKYVSNCLLANVISFSNEMASVADAVGDIHISRAFRILHEDHRLKGSGIASYIYPGAGYGGYCLPKDTKALAKRAKELNVPTAVLDAGIDMNERMIDINVQKIKQACHSPADQITILGLSFKPESDDVRATISAGIIQKLLEEGYNNINAHDPLAVEGFKAQYPFDIEYSDKLGDVVVIATAWPAYKHIATQKARVVDLRFMT